MEITGTNSTSGAGADSINWVEPKQTLDQDDFLKLLIAQLSAQDPMNPVSNAEFIGQMAQFSTLEQTKGLSSELSAMRADQQVLQANGMLGRDVSLRVNDSILHGTVTAVEVEAGTPRIVVDGVAYDLSQVLMIAPASTQPQV